jgi:hypothetical protein
VASFLLAFPQNPVEFLFSLMTGEINNGIDSCGIPVLVFRDRVRISGFRIEN